MRRLLFVKKHRSYNLFHIIFQPLLRSFLWQLYDIVVRLIKLNSKLRRRLYVKKHRSYNLFHNFPTNFISFLWQLYDIVPILIKLNSKFRTN